MDEVKKITSVSQYVDLVVGFEYCGKRPIGFRGQANEAWPIQAKLFRKTVGIDANEREALRDLISIHPEEFRSDQTMFDRLVRMQHFGLPTRLLDITTNPLVALYFATEIDRAADGCDGKVQAFFLPQHRQKYYDSDLVSCLANIANLTAEEKRTLFSFLGMDRTAFNKQNVVLRLISFIKAEKPYFEANIDPSQLILPVLVKPKMSNRRIIAQSGAFLLFGKEESDLTADNTGMMVQRLLIDTSQKTKILAELETLGVHEGTIYPEIDKSASLITKRYTNRS